MRKESAVALGIVAAALVLAACTDKPAPPPPVPQASGASPPSGKPDAGASSTSDPAAASEPPSATAPGSANPPASAGAPPAPPTAGPVGSIAGKILAPKAQPDAPVANTKDVPPCPGMVNAGSVLVNPADGALANAVVYLKGLKAPAGWPPAGATYAIDNKGCSFVPRLTIVPAGSPVSFTNGDPILHNIKTTCSKNDAINQGIAQNGSISHTFLQSEFIGLGCSVHPFMGGVLVVADHPWYALTDAAGGYKLANVPPGTYKLFVWHEVLGKAVAAGTPVTVSPGATTTQDVKFE